MSEKLLPIVPGCKALLTGAKNKKFFPAVGSEVICINPSELNGWWNIESPLLNILKDTHKGVHSPEYMLLRIDGFDFKHERDSYELPLEMVK